MGDTMASRWLGVTATSGADKRFTPSLVGACEAMVRAYPQLSIDVNFFDANPPIVDAAALVQKYTNNHPRVHGYALPGMKTLFWKRHLTPSRTRHLEIVWLFDSDIAVHPSAFPLGQLASILQSTRATVLQPSVRALVHGTHHTFLRVRAAHMSCLATTAMWVEMQTPLFTGDAWAAYHENVLSVVSDDDLAVSDYGIDISWCAALRDAFPTRPACLVTPAEAATHLNTHAIEKFMAKPVVQKVRSCAGTCTTLLKHFKRYWKNFTHHTTACWGVQLGSLQQTGLVEGGRFSIDAQGYARARRDAETRAEVVARAAAAAVAASENASAAGDENVALGESGGGGESGDGDGGGTQRVSTNIWVGATSVASHSGSYVAHMVSSLHMLLKRHQNGRIVLNMHDGPGGNRPRPGGPVDMSNDARITTTWVRGPRLLFWKRILDPRSTLLEGVSIVWLFDPGTALHPAVVRTRGVSNPELA